MHLWRAVAAAAALENNTKEKNRLFYEGIIHTARFYIKTVLPVTLGKADSVQALCDAALTIDQTAF
jgi:hypothetical protein